MTSADMERFVHLLVFDELHSLIATELQGSEGWIVCLMFRFI